VDDAIGRYRAASDLNDVDGLLATLTPDIELVSPISGRMIFRGLDDVRIVLDAVYGSIRGLSWYEAVGEGTTRVVMGDGFVGPFKFTDAMVCVLADDGRIRRISPHLRPWLALTLLALKLAVRVGRHPGVVLRALKRPLADSHMVS
jgi:hypothetical protein